MGSCRRRAGTSVRTYDHVAGLHCSRCIVAPEVVIKNLIIAILIAVLLSQALGGIGEEFFDLHIMMGDDLLSGSLEWIVMAGVCVLLVVVGFIVAISVAAAVGVAIVATLIGLLFAGVSVFWPVLLIIGVVMLVGRNKNSVAH